MSKRTVFSTITPLPPGLSRETVLETLHNHLEMIDLNPLVVERHPCKPPPNATAEEYHCTWYQMTDKVQYLPGDLATGQVSYFACFHDLPTGLQTHVYAPLGLNIKGKWSLGGSLPGEPKEPVELGMGIPRDGLWLREDVDMKCNIMMTTFVKKTLKKSHASLVDKMVEKAHVRERQGNTERIPNTRTSSETDASGLRVSNFDATRQQPGAFPVSAGSSYQPSISSVSSNSTHPSVHHPSSVAYAYSNQARQGQAQAQVYPRHQQQYQAYSGPPTHSSNSSPPRDRPSGGAGGPTGPAELEG